MNLSPTSLCSYCNVRPPRLGDFFCCDGCKILSELGGFFAKSENAKIPADDPAFLRTVGREHGPLMRFECHVDPLSCEACLHGLARLEKQIPGLRDLQWNRRLSVLSFAFAKGEELPSRVFHALNMLKLTPRWKTDEDSSQLKTLQNGTLRLGLTGGLAANIMLFSVPIYAGLAGSLQSAFEWIQLVLFLPIFLWSAQPFYRTAWISLRLKQLSVDLPLAIAFVAGSLFSIAAVLAGLHQVYFDSLAGFLFLILWSRSLLENSLSKYLESPGLERFFEKPMFEIERQGVLQKGSWKDLQVGDVFCVTCGDRVPVDGELLSNSAEFETAWMTGEKIPHWRLMGSLIQAGGVLLSKSAKIRVSKTAAETEFARLLARLKQGGQKLTPSFEAQLGSGLVLACFTAIACLLVFGSKLSLQEIGARSVALLIVACPCAVSFAAPLARAKANQIAFKKGLWIQDPLVWNRLTNVRKLAFDKTGTLTGGFFTLAAHSPLVDPHWKRIILSLENISRHPIAESLRRAWGPMPLFDVQNAREVAGQGVQGQIENSVYLLRGAERSFGPLYLELLRDGKKVVELVLQDEATPEIGKALNVFQRSYLLYIISGDHPQRVWEFGIQNGFDPANIFGGLNPQQKLEKLNEVRPDVYFGDGTNDLLALKNAPVSIAVSSASQEAQAAADILMLDAGFSRCEELFQIAKATSRLNRRNLGLALLYNIAAGSAALAGWIHPLGAAILMPIASMSLLASTLMGNGALRRLEKSE